LRQSCLGAIRRQVLTRFFLTWHSRELGRLYGKGGGGRAARLCSLLAHFAEIACRQWHDDVGGPLVGARPEGKGGSRTAPTGIPDREFRPDNAPAAPEDADELQYQELLQLLEEEIAGAEEEFEYEEKLNEERAVIERDACLAPAGEEWRMLLRREEALDRAIDRKIKLLLSLRKELERSRPAELRSDAPAEDAGSTAHDAPAAAGVPLVGAEPEEASGPPNEEPCPSNQQPSPQGRGCQAPAVSSAGA
jgi:hypothetical protein